MKSILFICSSLGVGGCEKVLLNLANKLVLKENFKVSFLVSHKGGEFEQQVNEKIEVFSTNCKMLLSSQKIKSFIHKNYFDYIICGPSYTNLVVLKSVQKTYIKVIATHHNYKELDNLYPFARFLFPILCRRLYSKAYKIIAVSNGVKDYLLEYKNFNNIAVIYNPVSVSYSIEDEKNQKKIIDELKLNNYFISIGRLSSEKNLQLMINAFEKFCIKTQNYKLIIVGDGYERKELENLINRKKMQNKIFLVGKVNNPYYLLGNARCLLQSSLTEALPTVIIEALLLQKLVISTPTKGAREILNNGKYGIIANDFSETAFVTALNSIGFCSISKKDIEKRARFFSEDRIVNEYCKLFEVN